MTNIYNEDLPTTNEVLEEMLELISHCRLTPYEKLKMLYVLKGVVATYLSAHEKPKQKCYIPGGY